MNCTNCGHDNPTSNAFCEQCGKPIGAPVETPAETATATRAPGAAQSGTQEANLQPADGQPSPAGQAPQARPKKRAAIAAVAILCALAAIAGAFIVIDMQKQADLPVVYGAFEDSRPASDDHGQFLSFQVEEDAASSDDARHYAVISAEWVPGKYDLDGYEVELENDRIDIVARVALQDEGDTVAFTPAETLSEGIDWQVSGSFDSTSVTLREGYWTIETEGGMRVPVYVDDLVLPYEGARIA